MADAARERIVEMLSQHAVHATATDGDFDWGQLRSRCEHGQQSARLYAAAVSGVFTVSRDLKLPAWLRSGMLKSRVSSAVYLRLSMLHSRTEDAVDAARSLLDSWAIDGAEGIPFDLLEQLPSFLREGGNTNDAEQLHRRFTALALE